jgi:hypothetical protein
MLMPLPWKSKPVLTEERLNVLASQFREIYYAVESLLDTDDDCNYGRGALFFSRSRQRLIHLSTAGDHSWLKLVNPAMDVTVEIEGVPFRFFRDDHDAPKKKGFWRRNESDRLFAPDDSEAVMFRFIVQRPLTEDDELEVYFVGYNAAQESICEWRYGHVRVLHAVDDALPEAVAQEAASADILDPDAEQTPKTASNKST